LTRAQGGRRLHLTEPSHPPPPVSLEVRTAAGPPPALPHPCLCAWLQVGGTAQRAAWPSCCGRAVPRPAHARHQGPAGACTCGCVCGLRRRNPQLRPMRALRARVCVCARAHVFLCRPCRGTPQPCPTGPLHAPCLCVYVCAAGPHSRCPCPPWTHAPCVRVCMCVCAQAVLQDPTALPMTAVDPCSLCARVYVCLCAGCAAGPHGHGPPGSGEPAAGPC